MNALDDFDDGWESLLRGSEIHNTGFVGYWLVMLPRILHRGPHHPLGTVQLTPS